MTNNQEIMKMKSVISGVSVSLLCLLSGCERSGSESYQRPPTHPGREALAAFFTADVPSETVTVGELLQDPPEGGVVTVEGKIGGTPTPFGDGYAVFFLADESLVFCNEMGDDHCPTPWDACCEDPDKASRNRILVQFSDETGEIVAGTVKGVNDLREMDRVVIRGKVLPAAGGGVVMDVMSLSRISGPPSPAL
ncbi:MAG: hypothetical protein ACQKBT_01240 [Puniceicoccales bacterium]